MDTFFNFSSYLYDYFFRNWNVTSTLGLTGVCFLCALLSLFLQFIKRLENKYQINFGPQISNNFCTFNTGQYSKFYCLALCTGLYTVQILLDYFLMLSVMTFNAWLLISVTTGAGIGYLVFAKVKAVNTVYFADRNTDSSENNSEPVTPRSDNLLVH